MHAVSTASHVIAEAKRAPAAKRPAGPAVAWKSALPVAVPHAARWLEAAAIMVTGYASAQNGTGAALSSLVLAVAATVLFRTAGLYTLSALEAPRATLGQITLGWLTCVLAFTITTITISPDSTLAGTWLSSFAATGVAALAASRLTMAVALRRLRRAGAFTRTAVIYGSGGAGEALAATLAASANADIRVAGLFDDRHDGREGTPTSAAPHLGDLAALKAFVRENSVDVAIMALPLGAETRVAGLLQRLADLPVDIRLAATASTLQLAPAAYSYVGGVPMIDLANRPIAGIDAIAKRALDLVVASLAVIALAPIMLMVAAAVRLESKGPALFRQKRYGFNNELIEVYKFRSMYTDRADATASKLVTRNDPRVTRIGRIIRKSSLDELPQLFNVLRGTLSLVGPRPHAVEAKAADRLYPEVVATYFARHKVKPGITGWAQINGWRGETDTAEKIQQRVAFDLDYISRWSVGLDLYILAKTPLALIKTDSAY